MAKWMISNAMTTFSPREIVSELDRYIIGQKDAKRAVAIALRNRWRRQQLDGQMREEVMPKNILMIGPTGVGKTEISRRLAKLAGAPFIKVEATKFTEVGYVGRDVEQIIRDLVEVAHRPGARQDARGRQGARPCQRRGARARRAGRQDRQPGDARQLPQEAARRRARRQGDRGRGGRHRHRRHAQLRDPRHARRQHRRVNINDMLSKAMGGKRTKTRKTTVKESYDAADQRRVRQAARPGRGRAARRCESAENDGIVFLDEIDKIAARDGGIGAGVSREGVQRDLLPLVEGTTVATKYGPVKTDHILFIASGAFHVAKPSDLLPELQGRLPIRVELRALDEGRFPPHPDRDRGQPDQAVHRADEDRRRRRSTSPTTPSTRSPTSPSISTPASRTSARGGCRR